MDNQSHTGTEHVECVLRMKDAMERLKVCRFTLMRWERLGIMPRRRVFGPGVKGWLAGELTAWMRSRPRQGDPARH